MSGLIIFLAILGFVIFANVMQSINKRKGRMPAKNVCPECRTKGAKSSFKGVRCLNSECARYDATLTEEVPSLSTTDNTPHPSHQGSYDPGADAIRIRYRNYRGEDVTLTGDAKTLWKGEDYIGVRVTPTGKTIRLNKKFIKNLSELERSAQAADSAVAGDSEPHGVERQILSYHLKRGSTSPRFEKVRRKFPNWAP